MKLNKSQAQEFGRLGERWAFRQLQGRGFDVQMNPDFAAKNCDLKIGHLPVEVKIALPTWRRDRGVPRRRWQFYISPTAALMQMDWLLILIAQDGSGYKHPYILPGNAIQDRRHIQLTSHPSKYRGWLAYYFRRWEIVDGLLNRDYDRLIEWERAA